MLDPETDSFVDLKDRLPEILTTELTKCRDLRAVVERDKELLEVRREISYQFERKVLFDQQTRAKLNKIKGANVALAGKIYIHGDEMRVDAKIATIEGGEYIVWEYVQGSPDQLSTLKGMTKLME